MSNVMQLPLFRDTGHKKPPAQKSPAIVENYPDKKLPGKSLPTSRFTGKPIKVRSPVIKKVDTTLRDNYFARQQRVRYANWYQSA